MTSGDGSLRHRVVVVGGGFGGLQAVLALRGTPAHVTLIDRRSFHLFQPLVYQVATGMLSPDEVATPLRRVLRRRDDVRVVLGVVTGFDVVRHVVVAATPDGNGPRTFPYDTLIVAAGSSSSYFGHEDWRDLAPDIKSLDGALEVRRRIGTALEAAELESDPQRRDAWLTFVVAGAGPTGVELAGQIAETARETLRGDFRNIDTGATRILLVEGTDRVLPGFPQPLSVAARRALEELGVTVVVEHRIVDVDRDHVTVEAGDGARQSVAARTVVWAAGVVGAGLGQALTSAVGAPLARGGRVPVGPGLTIAGHPEILVLGDMAQVHDGAGRPVPLPGLAPVAMQQGRYAARVVAERIHGAGVVPPFRYRDRGQLATIGRAKAVADMRGLRFTGLPAWLVWLSVHLFFLIGLQDRLVVMVRWTFSYLTRAGSVRLVVPEDAPGAAVPEPREQDRVGR